MSWDYLTAVLAVNTVIWEWPPLACLFSFSNRVPAFDITDCKTTATPSVVFCFILKTAKQWSSKFYIDLRNTSSLELTKYYCVNCSCSAVTMPIKLSSYTTWSTSETVASVALRKYLECDFVTSFQPLYLQLTPEPLCKWCWLWRRSVTLFFGCLKREIVSWP